MVYACLPSPSLRNQLTCPVAMSSVGHAGKGKSYFSLDHRFCELADGVSIFSDLESKPECYILCIRRPNLFSSLSDINTS